MSEQTRVYHFMHYIINFKNKIIVYASERPAPYNYFININHAELE